MKKILLLIVITVTLKTSFGNIIYVNTQASGSNDGTSWLNAYNNLDTAFFYSNAGDSIWVAKGVYKPGDGIDRKASFFPKNNVKVFAGFVGNETNLSERDFRNNVTTLSGNIGDENTSADNIYSVVQAINLSQETLLDGFLITDGNANYSDPSSRYEHGGGMILINGNPVFRNCIFYNNYAERGGAVYDGGSALFENCKFISNKATEGGALHVKGGATAPSAHYIGCLFNNNFASKNGGAIYSWKGSFRAIHCTFVNNQVDIDLNYGHSSLLYNYQYNTGEYVDFGNCVISGNGFGLEGREPIYNNGYNYDKPYVATSLIQNDLGDYYICNGVLKDDPIFVNPLGNDGILGTLDDDYSLDPCSPGRNYARASMCSTFGKDMPEVDLHNNPRLFEDYLEPGAYEIYFTSKPTAPQANNFSRCGSGALTLSATNGNVYAWYSDTTENSLHVGEEFLIDYIENTDTFFVSNSVNCIESVKVPVIVTVLPLPDSSFFTKTICNGDSVLIGDVYQKSAGVYYTSVPSFNGCDSITETTLMVNPDYNLTETITINSGEDYTFPDGTTQNNITSQIKHISNLKTDIGCDSIIETTINIKSDSDDLFSKSDISFRTNLIGSTLSFGDYDKDGDQDILYSGTYHVDTSILARVLRNDGNSFSNQTIIQYEQYTESGFIDWKDIDNDQDLDIIMGYEDWMNSEYATQFYQNTDANFSILSEYEIDLFTNGVWCDWGDYNNDGLVDLVISGSDSNFHPATSIYKNTGSGFVKVFEEKIENLKGSSDFGDYDNDGDLDLLLFGYGTGRAVGKIYKNTGDDFVEAESSFLPELQYGSCAWVDFNSDGYLDIFLTGRSYTEGEISRIYQNNGSVFEEKSFSGLAGMYFHDYDFGDYDNDGYLDIVGSGRKSDGERIFSVFSNELTDFVQADMVFNDTISGDVEWQDYDQDGDLDFVAIGIVTSDYYSDDYYNDYLALYKNNITVVNNKASKPQNLSFNVSGHEVNLKWNKAEDAETPQNGLSYNIEVYKTDAKSNILVASVNELQFSENGYTLKNLSEGDYIWKVQAFDTGLKKGEFSDEQSFKISGTTENTYFYQVSVCEGESYVFGNQNLTEAGEYTKTFKAADNTDSTVVLTLTLNPVYDITEIVSINYGSDYTFPDETTVSNITSQFEHISYLKTTVGCDSIIATQININECNEVYKTSEDIIICEGDTYVFPDGTRMNNITDDMLYTSDLISGGGCDSIVETNIHVEPAPEPLFSFICDSVKVSFTNESENSENYFWDFGDGDFSFQENPVHVYPELGYYDVRLKAINNCGGRYLNKSIEVVYIETAIDDLNKDEILVYPNPVSERIFIDYKKEFLVEIYNLAGIKLMQSTESDIDVSKLVKGSYIVLIKDLNGEIIQKVKIIKR